MPLPAPLSSALRPLRVWFDSWSGDQGEASGPQRVEWVRIIPFILLHVAPLAVIWVGWSWTAVIAAVGLYLVRMFFITGFYHRYFSHRSYSTSRAGQLVLALLGGTCVQRGPLWWAAHHRHHHRHSDEPVDVHSPRQHGFIWSHVGWITARANFPTRLKEIPDLARYPELRFLDRFDTLIPFVFASVTLGVGMLLGRFAPGLGTNGPQLLVWGFFISTVALFHASVTINSLAHVFGRRVYPTTDDSKNSFLLALLTFGEGWHNNHHYHPGSARQGFRWWQVDMTYYLLVMLSWTRLIQDLHPVPQRVRDARAA